MKTGNISEGSNASSGIRNELEPLLIARTRNIPFRIAIGTNKSPKTVIYQAFAGFTTIEA